MENVIANEKIVDIDFYRPFGDEAEENPDMICELRVERTPAKYKTGDKVVFNLVTEMGNKKETVENHLLVLSVKPNKYRPEEDRVRGLVLGARRILETVEGNIGVANA